MRTKLTIAGLVAALIIGAGCGLGDEATTTGSADAPAAAAAESSAPAKPQGYRVGNAVSVKQAGNEATYTITKTEKHAKDDLGQAAAGSGQWLLLHLKVSVAKGQLYACDCALSLVDKTGRVYEQSFGSFNKREGFRPADLKAGQHTEGWVIFEAPKNLTGAKIQLKVLELFGDGEYAYWNL